ncbi:PulJ/GspJ family protein [Actinoplanes sp. CA-030573]|uniref:PulJ/GspJ family protein n=1 Tax=Actinoplanes sp. CA-030573 TaxID=3239898 RepID=UPI003D8A1FC4
MKDHDLGYSLIEMMVVLGIISVVGAVATTGILQVYRTNVVAESDAAVQSQLSVALLRLDRSIRYAYAIGTVHNEGAAGSPYVEIMVVEKEQPTDTTYAKRCLQLRLTGTGPRNQQLQSRSWTIGSAAAPSGWQPLASNLVGGVTPFVRIQPTQAVNHQLLTVRLSAGSGTMTKTSAVTYTALNTYAGTALDANGNPLAATAEPCYSTATRS